MTAPFPCVFQPRNPRRSEGTPIPENPEMFEFSGMSYLPKRHAFSGLRFGRRLAFLLSGSRRNEDGYGKDNRILHTAEISEKSEMGSGASTRKGDRVPLEHGEVNLERVRLGREAPTIGRHQRSTVGLLRRGAFARSRTLKGSNVRSL